MNAISQAFCRFNASVKARLDPASLHVQLTLAIAFASLLGLSGFSVWTSWKMQRMIIAGHSQELHQLLDHLPTTLASTSSSSLLQQELQQVVERLSTENRWVWIRQASGQVVAPSTLATTSADAATHWAATSPQPRIDAVGQRYLLWRSEPLQMNDQAGLVYVAYDVTQDYTMLLALMQNLGIGTLLASALLTAAGYLLVGRSLNPLRRTSQLASTQLGSYPEQARLNPTRVPSEMKDLAHTWNLLLEQVSKTGEQQRQFANDVSHELRTPLCVVYGYLQSIARRGTNLTEQQKEALDIATSETERTILLLQDLLDLVRAECKAIAFNLKPLLLNQVVAAAIAATVEFSTELITVETLDEPIWAIADPDYLSQVLIHLVRNAIQFGNGQPIVIYLYQSQAATVIEVRDRGDGIPAEHQRHIFEPFYRVDPSRARPTGGVGLGLAIAKSLVIGMGGTIRVTSTPDTGSTFTVQLPRALVGLNAIPLSPAASG